MKIIFLLATLFISQTSLATTEADKMEMTNLILSTQDSAQWVQSMSFRYLKPNSRIKLQEICFHQGGFSKGVILLTQKLRYHADAKVVGLINSLYEDQKNLNGLCQPNYTEDPNVFPEEDIKGAYPVMQKLDEKLNELRLALGII